MIAAAVLVTTSPTVAADVAAALATRVAATKHSLRIRDALGGTQSAIILVDSIADGLRVVDAYAAEHLAGCRASTALAIKSRPHREARSHWRGDHFQHRRRLPGW